MNQRLVTSASDVTADRLTTILRGAGHLRAGGVAEVAAQPHGDARTIEERTSAARLAVRYTPDARPALSRRLFLKCCRASIHGETSPRLMAMERREVAFYRTVAAATDLPVVSYTEARSARDERPPRLPVIACYDAQFDDSSGAAHFLLDDLEPTHMRWWDIAQPTPTNTFKQMAGAVARLHAAWWDHPRLRDIAEPPEVRALDRSHGRMDYVYREAASALTPERKQVVRRIVEDGVWDKLMRHFAPTARETLTHGDASCGNYLFPRDESEDTTVLLDWQLYEIGNPTSDLPLILVHPLAESHRQQIEREVLDSYLEALRGHGVTDYSRAQLHEDYRSALIRFLARQLFLHQNPDGIARAFSAFEDWDCLAALQA